MDHAAGLSGMDVMVTPEEMYDWDKMTGLLAVQRLGGNRAARSAIMPLRKAI